MALPILRRRESNVEATTRINRDLDVTGNQTAMNTDPQHQPSPPSTDDAAIAGRLRDTREFLGLSQTDVASAFGVSPADMADIETGERTVTAVELKRFSGLYRRPVAWLLGKPEGTPELDPSIYEATDELSEQDQETVLRFAEWLSGAGPPGEPYVDETSNR